MKRVQAAAGALALLVAAGGVQARQLGKIGPTYSISEPHLLEQIMARLRDAQERGDFDRFEREARARAEQAVRNPEPVAGLVKATHPRTYYFDPSFTLQENISDADGKVLFPAGLSKNPLEVVSLSSRLVFFDARDPSQVRTANGLIDRFEGRVKPILVGGSYIDLMKSWNRPVYFDQYGYLVRRLGIKAVPSLVSQDGMRLRIDEVVPQ
jgi:conjugal transfer pilus assembly protein TraW